MSEMKRDLNSGSRWLRWEPHIHAPGTVLNDQYHGEDRWERFLTALESSDPPIRAIGLTDYYSTATYEQAVKAKLGGRLARCDLLFPNIEMRLGIGTVKGRWVNLHLLVSPEDPDHVVEVKRFLARLTFAAYDDSFACSTEDLARLGQRIDPALTEPRAALALGTEQFKVSFEQLKKAYQDSAWAQKNILVAVAGSETDGTSGVRDAADATLRQEVEKFAHVIFAGSPAQREFWLGRRTLSVDELRARYGGVKPCMHGSDAHLLEQVGAPDLNRYSWIKGAPAFDTLRQACIDPESRAYVGSEPPVRATPSQVIERIEIAGAPWAQTPALALNPGLVAIIGARGSGKTALADMIALGCNATSEHPSDASFLLRAEELLHGATVSLTWQSGSTSTHNLDGSDDQDTDRYPRARYLSQQFVEELCTAHGITDALLKEIERVIFEAHPIGERDGAIDFQELLDLRAMRHREARVREEDALAELSERIGTELEKSKLVEGLKKQITDKEKVVDAYVKDRAKLVSKGSEARVQRLVALTTAAEKVRGYLRYYSAQEQSLLTLQDEVKGFRNFHAPETLRKSQEKHKASGIKDDDWDPFLLNYVGDVDATLARHLIDARKQASDWRGVSRGAVTDVQTALIADEAQLDRQNLALLEAEIGRLEKLISLDRETAAKFAAISKRIVEESAAVAALKEKLTDCEGAKDRAKGLVDEREAAYVRVFQAIVSEESVLRDLYGPLMTRLTAASGTLAKLAFSVSRVADVAAWASEGEDLWDLRKRGPFKGRGTLSEVAEASLEESWVHGDPQAVSEAMKSFRAANEKELLERASTPKGAQAEYRDWLKRFAKWLYGTAHISIQYSINYGGVDIRKLSPGTRGIVLLLLYLALDSEDDRPLIIDQPEENLDPKSVFDELAGLFMEAKSKRQVIIVTHNANLVVNTDADQIIVADAGTHAPGELPPISYTSGGLESEAIRTSVCDILEGGERAFRERARRLRVRLER